MSGAHPDNTVTGLISGAPTVAGAFNVALVAKNAKGARRSPDTRPCPTAS